VIARFAGIDVGERRLHCAVVDAGGRILDFATLPAGDPGALLTWCEGAGVVAIDAPEAPSTAPHADDRELAPKFRAARCAEVELGRRHGSWVPWVAPSGPPFPPWMETGFEAFRALRSGREHPEVLEVYPHAAFRELARGRRLARKQTRPGRSERSDLLARAGLSGSALAPLAAAPAGDPVPPSDRARHVPSTAPFSLSHDLLDALAAALVALDRFRRRARRVTCGHDGSAIWLPGPPR
jgi:predicted nuclease with RNAse H fold